MRQIEPDTSEVWIGGRLSQRYQIHDLVQALSSATWDRGGAAKRNHVGEIRRAVWRALLLEVPVGVELPDNNVHRSATLLSFCMFHGLAFRRRLTYCSAKREEVTFWSKGMRRQYAQLQPIGTQGLVPLHVITAGLQPGRSLNEEIARFRAASDLPGLALEIEGTDDSALLLERIKQECARALRP